jgi:DNA end-binding protein Ku
VCEKDGKELKSDEIAKAIDIAGECIQFTDDEIKNLHPFSTRTMEILGFCNFEEIPLISLGKSYYIGTENPKKGGSGQSFHLLKEVMDKMDNVAVVKWVQRNNEYIGVLKIHEGGFLLKQLLYFEQFRSAEEVEIIKSEVDGELVDKALQVAENMKLDFDWTEYSENYNQQLRELIEKKAAGEEIIPEIKPPETRSLQKELDKMLALMEEE